MLAEIWPGVLRLSTNCHKEAPALQPSEVALRRNVFVIGLPCPSWQSAVDRLEAQDFRIVRFESSADFLDTDHIGRFGVVVFDDADDQRTESVLDYCHSAQSRLTPILVSRSIDTSRAMRAMRAGAFDVVRDWEQEDLFSSVREASDRLRADGSPPGGAIPSQPDWAGLTKRQAEILRRILQGQPNKIIAADLGISQRTAENHRALIMKKMGVSSISNLVQVAIQGSAIPREHPSFAPRRAAP